MSTGPLNALGDVAAQARTGPSQVSRAAGGPWVRAMLLDPSRLVTVFWAGGVIAIASVLPLGHWPLHSLVALGIVAALCAAAFVIRAVAGRRLPRWTLHVDVGAASVLAGVLAAIGVTGHVPFADLYVWVALFAALYFRPLAVLAHIGGAGAAYAVALSLGPGVPDPVVAWLAVFGTVAVAAAAVLGVVSMLRLAATEDILTGLANRRSWDERLEEELERSRRAGTALSVATMDVDDLKAVNDSGGHEAGDRLLEELARAWQAAARGGGDFLARLGGDEFGLLAPGSDATGIRRLAKRIDEVVPEGVSCSVGVATWDRAEGGSDLVRRADRAMYQVKRRRRRGEGLRPA